MTRKVDGAPAVQVEGGRLRGRMDRGVAAFLGVPYAAPPFGGRRMRPPEPPVRWEGERPATEYGLTCPKGDYAPLDALFPEMVIPGFLYLDDSTANLGLLDQAVTQSGAAAATLTAEAATRITSMLAQSLGVAPTREALIEVPAERLGRAASVELPYVFDLLGNESSRALIGDAPPSPTGPPR